MSIKRTKQASSTSRNRESSNENNFGVAKPVVPEKPWAEQIEGKPDSAFVAYAMTERFEKGALVRHAKFGKGVVVGVEPQRIEVLFEEGTKKLGHGGA